MPTTDDRSTRDLLIELSTKVEYMGDQLEKINDTLNSQYKINSSHESRIVRLEVQTKENTGLRLLIYSSLAGSLVAIITSIAVYFLTRGQS